MTGQTKETGWILTPARREGHQRAQAAHEAKAAARREDYYWLRDEQGLTLEHAAARTGASVRQAYRWERMRREAATR